VFAPVFLAGDIERELRQRDPARIASGLAGNECARSSAVLGHIKFGNARPTCRYAAERRLHR